MPVEEIRKQMDVVARELWGNGRTDQLAEQIGLTAVALARVEGVELSSRDDFDYLEGR
jgi:hypothetical protein